MLPHIDLHRHLEGTIRPQTALDLAERHYLPLLRDMRQLCPLVQVTETQPDLISFIARLETAVTALADVDA